jgi:hypothetical protein
MTPRAAALNPQIGGRTLKHFKFHQFRDRNGRPRDDDIDEWAGAQSRSRFKTFPHMPPNLKNKKKKKSNQKGKLVGLLQPLALLRLPLTYPPTYLFQGLAALETPFLVFDYLEKILSCLIAASDWRSTRETKAAH